MHFAFLKRRELLCAPLCFVNSSGTVVRYTGRKAVQQRQSLRILEHAHLPKLASTKRRKMLCAPLFFVD
jgi:hypothetical protein